MKTPVLSCFFTYFILKCGFKYKIGKKPRLLVFHSNFKTTRFTAVFICKINKNDVNKRMIIIIINAQITYQWKLPSGRLQAKAKLEDSNSKSMKNDYVKLEPRPKEVFEISDDLTMDSGVQVIYILFYVTNRRARQNISELKYPRRRWFRRLSEKRSTGKCKRFPGLKTTSAFSPSPWTKKCFSCNP